MAKVKICGITTRQALQHAIEAGADLVGLVHFAKSPRHLDLETMAELASAARDLGEAKTVALLVNPDDALVSAVAEQVAPDVIQLHGSETPERVAEIRKFASGCDLWKALPVATEEDVAAAGKYLAPGMADLLLYDAKPPPGALLPGGNGLLFDWKILNGIAGRYPYVLAGGLTPDNVAAAISLTSASIVDVSSSVESAPGQKDPALVERFIAAAREVSQTAAK